MNADRLTYKLHWVSDLKDRLREARKEAGLTQSQLSQAVGVKQPVISDLEQGKQRSTASIVKIANVLNVNASWLDSGRGARNRIDHPLSAAGKGHQDPSGSNNALPRLPVINSVTAGQRRSAANPFDPGDADDWEVVTGLSPHAFVLRVEGDSMTSQRGGMSIPNGAKVAVEPNEQPENGSIVVAKLEGTKAVTIKKLVVEPPYNFLMPLNELYDRISVTEDCRIVGVVKKVIQDLR